MIKEKRDEKGGLYYDHSTIYKKEPDPFDSVKQFDNIKMKNEDQLWGNAGYKKRYPAGLGDGACWLDPDGPIQRGFQQEVYCGAARTVPVAKEKVNHPQHYNAGKIEVIDAICDWELDFIEGNVVKYITRAKHKGDELGDLKKARWYLDYLVKRLEKQNAT